MSDIHSYLDRNQPDYLELVRQLLTSDSLIKTAKPIDKNDSEDQKILERDPSIAYKASIYFSGIAALTLFGYGAKNRNTNPCATEFHRLLEKNVKQLNDHKVALQIKLLFAYPYSNFMYDLIYLEEYSHRFLTTQCIQENRKYEYGFEVEPKLTQDIIRGSSSVAHLRRTLEFIQNYITSENIYWNRPPEKGFTGSVNLIVVKFCPINTLTCMLRINNIIFLDPYMYTKENTRTREMALLTPISCIELPPVGETTDSDFEKQKDKHFCSYISHFKYLWEHYLTLYAADATLYQRYKGGLNEIKFPQEISYERKANRIERKMPEAKAFNDLKARADNWKQFAKNELLLNCSKVLVDSRDEVLEKTITPLNIFIAGAWVGNDVHKIMKWFEKWITDHFGPDNEEGLQLIPNIVRVDNSGKFSLSLYKELNSSYLGVVFQTSDLQVSDKESYCRPNVYFEKGYLMGKLRKRHIRTENDEYEAVFVFRERTVLIESDNNDIGHTIFDADKPCKKQVFKFIYWLWQVTSLNSEYALELIAKQENNVQTHDRSLYIKYKKEIEKYRRRFKKRQL